MTQESNFEKGASCILGALVFIIGVLFLVLVHPVPGIVALLLSLIYLPQANMLLKTKIGITIPLAVKIGLALCLTWFTLGVSDLGDMMDKL